MGLLRTSRRGCRLSPALHRLACPVCFAAEEISMVNGARLGVLVLLAVTLAVQGGSSASSSICASARSRRRRSSSTSSGRSSRGGSNDDRVAWTPPARHGSRRADRRLIGWTHMFMLILFIGWGAFFLYVLMRFRRSPHPVASYPGVTSHASTYLEGGRAGGRNGPAVRLLDPALGRAGRPVPPERRRWSSSVAAEQFAWNVHYPGPDGVFGRTDSSSSTSSRIRWASTRRSRREGRRHHAQSALPAGQPAGHREAQRARTSSTASVCPRCA